MSARQLAECDLADEADEELQWLAVMRRGDGPENRMRPQTRGVSAALWASLGAALLGAAVLGAALGPRALLAAALGPASTGSRFPASVLAELQATEGRANCNETRRCAAPGLRCYEQVSSYAQCRASCAPGPDPTHWDGQHWTCKELGERTPGEDQCVGEGADCRQSGCCRQPGHTCFEKSEGWATCKASCTPGPSFSDKDGTPWTCRKLGKPSLSTQPWVAQQCADGNGASCLAQGCCKAAGEQCFKKDDYYGSCKYDCPAGWSCETVGTRTPSQPAAEEAISALPEWAFSQCSGAETGCLKSRCCMGMDLQCYEKDEHWAQCKPSCTPGPHADDKNASWTCNTLGPRTMGVARKGSPSLYCFSVLRRTGYEVGLMQAQFAKGAGIAGCDDYNLLTADGTITIGGSKSIYFQGAPTTVSVDNTAGNTELFVHAWDAVINAGVWRNHTYTLKVDPDAVFLPDRARTHLRPYVGQKMFVINCPLGDMVFGALEVFSYYALNEWATRGHQVCPAPNNWGEDKYMTHCMDLLGVARIHDMGILADFLCTGNHNCQDGTAAAYHPFKDVGSWFACLSRATGGTQTPVVLKQ